MGLSSDINILIMSKLLASMCTSRSFSNFSNFNISGKESFSLSSLKAVSQPLVHVKVFFNKYDKGLEILEKL